MNDDFVSLLALLNDKIQSQAQEIKNLNDRIYRMEDDTSSVRYLREDLEYARNEVERYRNLYNTTYAENQRLKLENPKVKEDLESYMVREGDTLLRQGNKIACIKEVRNLTGWGLKESKDYVEARKVA